MAKSKEEVELITDCIILAITTLVAGGAVIVIIVKALEEVCRLY